MKLKKVLPNQICTISHMILVTGQLFDPGEGHEPGLSVWKKYNVPSVHNVKSSPEKHTAATHIKKTKSAIMPRSALVDVYKTVLLPDGQNKLTE